MLHLDRINAAPADSTPLNDSTPSNIRHAVWPLGSAVCVETPGMKLGRDRSARDPPYKLNWAVVNPHNAFVAKDHRFCAALSAGG